MIFVKSMMWILIWMLISFSFALFQFTLHKSKGKTLIQIWERKIIRIPLYIP